jgi:succinate-acetate transporter protein
VQRRALGLLFAVLTVAFALIAVAAAQAGRWPVALAAVVLGVWLGSLAVKGLRPR